MTAGSHSTRNVVIGGLVGFLVLVLAFGVVLVRSGSKDSAAASVATEPISTATDPFAPVGSVGTDQAIPPVQTSGTVTVRGGHVGLYGGTLGRQSCDKNQLATFLRQNPDKGAAWAGVIGIAPGQIAVYVAGLTPVLLRSDTLVTNHGFVNGQATSFPAVLQAGTAVLVDNRGLPVTKCYCGNPLTPPPTYSSPPAYHGPRWPGFSGSSITIIQQNVTIIDNFTLVDPATGKGFTRPPGTSGGQDTPSGQPTTTTTTTLPRVTIPTTPGTSGTLPPQTTPTPTTFRLASITVTRTYGGNIGNDPTGTHAVSNGTTTVPAGTRTFQLGWDYYWGTNNQSRNRTMATVALTTVPDTVTTGSGAVYAAQMSGDWIQTGYGVGRDRTLTLDGAAGVASRDFGGNPEDTVQGSISTSSTRAPSLDPTTGRVVASIDATIDFGNDHTGAMHIELVYQPVG